MYFRSKYDWWLIIIIVAAIIALILSAVENFPSVLSYVLIGISILMGWIFFGTGYWLLEDRIMIKCGPLQWTVILSEITSVRPTRNPLSAPASSVDRLEIHHKKGSVLVSPRNKQQFLQLLKERCPNA
ncbi:PH domain-containing protein [Dethiobacter alkaliphilus]|uniref:Uncharacterized protein YyaB-like PH domain-containing protein n=1 Tax=Dethiobacter alkaliphilus AHT 1 TaxID=555088 RepID=C0GI20_DETAL|nr:PH domain-containing protein [Dethiobacter alkaliphilus]EEG77094.1 protein of unknown function DUF1200 [Dethiobacter alkaliphilus AHT 1]